MPSKQHYVRHTSSVPSVVSVVESVVESVVDPGVYVSLSVVVVGIPTRFLPPSEHI